MLQFWWCALLSAATNAIICVTFVQRYRLKEVFSSCWSQRVSADNVEVGPQEGIYLRKLTNILGMEENLAFSETCKKLLSKEVSFHFSLDEKLYSCCFSWSNCTCDANFWLMMDFFSVLLSLLLLLLFQNVLNLYLSTLPCTRTICISTGWTENFGYMVSAPGLLLLGFHWC